MATIHNPTNFNPADYTVLDYLDNRRPEYFGQTVEAWREEIAFWEADMARIFGATWQRKIHSCVHCGNGRVRYITAVEHIPTGDVVVFGADCTARLGFADRMSWKLAQIKAKAEAGHARMKLWGQREAFVKSRPDLAAAIEQAKAEVHGMNTFVHDVIGKLNRFGSISDKQIAAVVASLQRDLDKANAPVEVKGDAPTGRVTVTGVVVGLKDQESAYGWTTKMTIKLANNARVWMTKPAGADVERGATVTVTATFEVSATDKSFAFGKRPIVSKVQNPTPAPEATPAGRAAGDLGTAAIQWIESDTTPTLDAVFAFARAAAHNGLEALGATA